MTVGLKLKQQNTVEVFFFHGCMCTSPCICLTVHLHHYCAWDQWWNVTKYMYSSTDLHANLTCLYFTWLFIFYAVLHLKLQNISMVNILYICHILLLHWSASFIYFSDYIFHTLPVQFKPHVVILNIYDKLQDEVSLLVSKTSLHKCIKAYTFSSNLCLKCGKQLQQWNPQNATYSLKYYSLTICKHF